jgi:hypothetical protein
MDADLLIKRLIARVVEWRVESLHLHQQGFDFEGSTLCWLQKLRRLRRLELRRPTLRR